MAEKQGAPMPRAAIRRCIRHLVVLIPVAIYTGHAAGHSPPPCPNSPAVRTLGIYTTQQTQTGPIARETPIWKTITVGGLKGVNATRAAMETAPCPIWIGDEADEILGRPAFPFNKTPFELDLVVLS